MYSVQFVRTFASSNGVRCYIDVLVVPSQSIKCVCDSSGAAVMFCLFVCSAAEPALSVLQKVCNGKDEAVVLPETPDTYIIKLTIT